MNIYALDAKSGELQWRFIAAPLTTVATVAMVRRYVRRRLVPIRAQT